MNIRDFYFLAATAALGVLVFGLSVCSIGTQSAWAKPKAPFSIVTTTGMVTDIAQRVAGSRATVTGLMGPGVDPHLYKPTRSDIATLSRADIVFYNGLLLEGKLTDALIRVASSGKKVHPVTELLDTDYLLEPVEFEGVCTIRTSGWIQVRG